MGHEETNVALVFSFAIGAGFGYYAAKIFFSIYVGI